MFDDYGDAGLCIDCGCGPEESHAPECADTCDRRFMKVQRENEIAHDFLDFFEVNS